MPMKRRDFIMLAVGAAVWPLVARAEESGGVRRVGVLLPGATDDSEYLDRVAAFRERLGQLGWIDGNNIRLDIRWGAADAEQMRKFAIELVALAPDVLLAPGSSSTGPLLQATRTIPIVFATIADPVAAGFVDTLSKPGGNVTGFTSYDYSIGGKWLELLKEITPGLVRVAVVRDPTTPAGVGQLAAIQAVAPSLGVELVPINLRDPVELEHAIAAFAHPSSALLVAQSAGAAVHRKLLVDLAAKHRLPTVFPGRHFVAIGGLMSYGPDLHDQYRQAAGYVDRILKGEKPADLPVQASTKYTLAINLKTAKALGITVSPTLLSRADDVIE
jgi:putative tryptophan/tyrosine transport system substrate-binding protein